MPPVERPITDDNAETPEECQEQTISRRKLLKVVAATGGTVAATMLLPSKWAKPVVEVGVLPVHAQATDTPLPTGTPTLPVVRVQGCDVVNAAGGIDIGPADTIETWAQIQPALSGILLEMTVMVNEPGHPEYGNIIFTDTTTTDASGLSSSLYFDLNNISPALSSGIARLIVTWTIIDTTVDGRDACSHSTDIT